KRPLRQEGQEPQAGDCDRTVGGEGQGQEGAEEGGQEAEGGKEESEEVEAEGEAVAASLPSLRGAKRRSNPESRRDSGLLRFARNDGNCYPALRCRAADRCAFFAARRAGARRAVEPCARRFAADFPFRLALSASI